MGRDDSKNGDTQRFYFRTAPKLIFARGIIAACGLFKISAEEVSMLHLLVRVLSKSGDSFVGWIGTTGLGWWLQAFILFIVTEIATYLVLWHLRGKDAMKARARENLKIGCYVWLIVLLVVYSPIFAYAVAHTLYADHEALVSENGKLATRNAAIRAELDARKQHLSTTDPVFGNINSLLMAFDMYRHARH